MVLGENSKISGDVESLGTILIEGTVLGNIHGEKIILGEKAYVRGDLSAIALSIAGKVEGHLLCKESVELKSTAKITGDITTKTLSILDGALFNGMCRMDGAQNSLNPDIEQNVVEFTPKEREERR